jgi:hypothetical protein
MINDNFAKIFEDIKKVQQMGRVSTIDFEFNGVEYAVDYKGEPSFNTDSVPYGDSGEEVSTLNIEDFKIVKVKDMNGFVISFEGCSRGDVETFREAVANAVMDELEDGGDREE